MISFCYQCGSFYRSRFVLCCKCFERALPYCHIDLSDKFCNSYVTSQFLWNESTQSFLFPAIKNLKTIQSYSQAKLFIDNLPNWFTQIPASFFVRHRQIGWVPVPSLSNPMRNHYLAQIFQKQIGGRIVDILKCVDKSPQKNKSYSDRQNIIFASKGGQNDLSLDETLFIFVDDIVTTGATLRACQKSLNLDYLIAWTFAYRLKLS